MKVIIALALLLAVTYADMNCWYTSPSTNAVYSLEDLAYTSNHWMNATDVLGNTWFWKVCDDGSEDLNPLCGEDSSVCMSDSNGIHNRGTTSTAQWADIQQDDTGLTVIFSADDTCNDGEPIKTVINYICLQDYTDVAVNADGVYITIDNAKTCFVTLNVYTEEACAESSVPEDGTEYDGNWNDGDWDNHSSSYSYGIIFTPFLTFGLLLTVTVLFTCLCCCCMIRRRRRCQKKAIAMKQFSNIAFQPIPSTHSTINKAQPTSQFVNVPSYNPYVTQQNQQPQYVYYYPDQQQNVVPLQTFNDSQVVSDEKLAKELQSQFDRERV